jgi:integrase
MSKRATAQLFSRFAEWGFDQRGWSATTRRRYASRARAADEWLVRERGCSLAFARGRDLQAYLFSTSPTARNRNNVRQALVAFCDFLVWDGLAAENCAAGLPRLPEPPLLPKAMTLDQARAVHRAAHVLPIAHRTLVLLLLYGGLRRSEARLLEWSHVDPDAEWIRFPGKRGRERAVPLHPVLREALLLLRAHSREARWVFASPRVPGAPISDSYFRGVMTDVEALTGIAGFHAHACRHTAATLLLEGGADLRTVQEYLGHADPKTTAIYTKVRPVRVREAVVSLDLD